MFRLSPRLPALLWPIFHIGRGAFRHAPLTIYGFLMSRAAPSDWKILGKSQVRRNLIEGIAEGLRPGVRASMQEMRLFSRTWDVPVAGIRAPAKLWQGLSDRNVPVSAAFRLGELIPGCEVQPVEKAGHYWVLDHSAEVLQWLAETMRGKTAQAGRAGGAAAKALS
jgi:pimeloyl-ACP methyl ester carboxylesterase